MPDITFTCPKCDQELEAPEDFAGQDVECPGCGTAITVPQAAAQADAEDDLDANELEDADEEPTENVEEGVCPECGAEMDPDAVLCLGCGYHARLGRRIQTDFDNP